MPADAASRTPPTPDRALGAVPSAGLRLPSWLVTLTMLLPTYAWLTLAILLPLGAMLSFSFMTATPLGKKEVAFTFKHYRAFIDQPYLIGVAWTSLLIGLWTTFLCAVVGFFTALALARATAGRLRETLLILVILPFWTNGLVRVFSWTMVIREGGFLDLLARSVWPDAPSLGFLYSLPAIILGLVHGYLPYMVLTCYIALVTIDDSILEAAESLGARKWTVLWRIIVPMAAPGLISGSVLIFVPVIGAFMEPRILGGPRGVTLGTVIEEQFTQAFNWPLGAALSFTILALVLGIFATFSGVLRRSSSL
ncbi:spermidine/putrescine transport system permease protein [Angulomicrobium amanitiforme]|uniref:Spermidine/putrescine transport system permease protein n=3 Tax=Xanthobacteraceae TaxID=335928 RepID=A0A839Z977_9HYPH|nr:spermidine/putrescine transport system permease protein [Ancylobacter tetraedralis]MDQ0509143.1 spermidine/putrescine transport system permease protein [Ancylobacter amanitiformis]